MASSFSTRNDKKVQISLIIPIFNSEKYISQFLDKLIDQSFENIEILCIDYGSSDESKKLILKYCNSDSRISFFESENINLARNKGIRKSQGEYVLFLNPEDLLYVNSCEMLLETLVEDPCDILFFKSSLLNESNNEFFDNSIDFDLDFINDFVGGNIFTPHEIFDKIFLLPMNWGDAIFRKELLLNSNLFSNHNFCDFSFFFEVILSASSLKILNKHIYIKREFKNEINRNYFEKVLDDLDRVFNFFKNSEYYDIYERRLLNFIIGKIYNMYLYWEYDENIYLLIRKYFNIIKEDKFSYVRYISNLDNENLFFFRDVLKAKTSSEYCLLVKYNQLFDENGKLTSDIFRLKKEINQLKYQLSFFE